jgi:hypothetical protein
VHWLISFLFQFVYNPCFTCRYTTRYLQSLLFLYDGTIVCRLYILSMVTESGNFWIVPVAYGRRFWLVWILLPCLRGAALLGEVKVFETPQVFLWWICCILSRDVGLVVKSFRDSCIVEWAPFSFYRCMSGNRHAFSGIVSGRGLARRFGSFCGVLMGWVFWCGSLSRNWYMPCSRLLYTILPVAVFLVSLVLRRRRWVNNL